MPCKSQPSPTPPCGGQWGYSLNQHYIYYHNLLRIVWSIITHLTGIQGTCILLCKASASGWDLPCRSTQVCAAMGCVHNEARRTLSDISWCNVSSLAESLISMQVEPTASPGLHICRDEVKVFETESLIGKSLDVIGCFIIYAQT